jgi:hypothetical protein
MVTKISRNVHRIDLPEHNQLAILSDLHWDNPKCQREKLKKHLDYCLERNIPVFINGDFFCLMQGRGDKRANKSEIRPEHNNARYLDSIVETALDWFEPYKEILTVIGYGNHETAIIKYQETDLLQRFVDLFNYKFGVKIYTGGYGGWLLLRCGHSHTKDKKNVISKRLKYYHGSGGGGVVTRGEINLTRSLEMIEGMDIYTLGHIHENKSTDVVRECFEYNKGKREYEYKHKNIHLMVTGTYKEEFGDGGSGWHVERNAPVKPIGGRILTINVNRYIVDGVKNFETIVDSSKFPI